MILTMEPTPLLSLSVLGGFQLLRNGDIAPKFKYLDARELCVYLLWYTMPAGTSGKTKHEIGAALWGDVSSVQLNARFKARLNDVRHVLGGRDWIVFKDETYRFNFAHLVAFDVREFLHACKDAEQHERAGQVDATGTSLQRAVALYRGDFMQDYHTRSRKDLYGEREWYLQVREDLQAKYRRVLEGLTEIELHRAHHDAAIELLRKRVALDEYDDRAHQQLIWTLALQGKRSQALRHYHNLIQLRSDTPPDTELTALFEKIKRNEPLGEHKPTDVAIPYSPFANPAKIPPPFQVPIDLPRFVGRVKQFDILQNDLSQAHSTNLESPISRLCLVGMGGIGKTSLAIHAAYQLRGHFPDGVLWGNLRESEPLAILGSWERAYGCDFSGLPDLNARAASLRSLLHDKKVLVILDDVVDAAQARPLLLNGTQTRTVITSRSVEIAAALGAFSMELPVLHPDESADLLTRSVGTARVAGQESFAQAICELLGHLPLALDITAQRLVSRPHWSLRGMAERLQVQMQRLDELQLADRAVRATFALSWDALNDAQKLVLAQVGVFDARSFTAPALAFVAEIQERSVRVVLDELVSLSLLSHESSTRYRQHPLVADFSLERLSDAVWSKARMSDYYLQFATGHRRDYLSLEQEWDNLNVGIGIAHAQASWQAVIDYGDVLTDAWFARGRFTDARRNYPFVLRAARELEEQDPYITGTLNWGKACIDQGDYAEAEEHLQHVLQTSREVSDEYGIASGLFLLARVAVERGEYEAAQKYLEECQGIRERLGDRAGMAETLYMQARIKYLAFDFGAANILGEKALKILDSFPSNQFRIVISRWLAVIASYLKDFERAVEHNERALVLAEEMGNVGETAMTLYSMATVFWRKGDFVNAEDCALKSMPLIKSIGDRKAEEYVSEQLSKIALNLEKYDKAMDYGQYSLRLSNELNDTFGKARQLQHLGDVYRKIGQDQHACQMWLEALSFAQALQNNTLVTSLQERIMELQCQ